jgi:site-specific DNA-methyltransferase (adenine-specific)
MSNENVVPLFEGDVDLSTADNTSEGLKILRAANERFRQVPWPEPFRSTIHRIWQGDARDLSAIPNESVHLVVTSPPTGRSKSTRAGAARDNLARLRTMRRS